MKIVLITVVLTLVLIVIITLLIMYLRKIQYDAIQQGLLSLEDRFGGKIIRTNALVRPFYKSEIKGRELRVGFTSEKYKNKRVTYVHYTLQCRARYAASIMHANWFEGREEDTDQSFIKLEGGKFLLQVKGEFPMTKRKRINEILNEMPEFAYILVAKTGIILERMSAHLIDREEEEKNKVIIHSLLQLADLLEK